VGLDASGVCDTRDTSDWTVSLRVKFAMPEEKMKVAMFLPSSVAHAVKVQSESATHAQLTRI
jgi:hypothetical protein